MRSLPPWGIIAIGSGLGVLGWLVIFLTAVRVIPASFWLLVLAWGVHVAGLFMGLIGLGMYAVRARKK